jgi:hypothetical protein
VRSRRVIAQVSAEVVKPLSDRPYEGFVNLTTEISPMASAVYEAGRSVNTGSPAWRGDPFQRSRPATLTLFSSRVMQGQ